MNERKKVMKWLGRARDLELEIKILNASKDKYMVFLSARGTPNPSIVGGRGTHISRPTEDSVVLMDKYKEKIDFINEQIQLKEEEIEAIKTQTELIYCESKMKAEWYQAICYFYFESMSIYEIAHKVGYGESTIKMHKGKGVAVLAERYEDIAC